MKTRAVSWPACVLLAGVLLGASSVQAQVEPKPKPVDVEAASLPLRTALYHDPTLAPPLDRLLQIYRDANRAKELVDTYRQHVAQYPADTGALIVLIRLLQATNDAEADRLAPAAAARFPEQPYLQYLNFLSLQKTRAAGALDALDRAITKETLPARKRVWIEQLLPLAAAEGRVEIAQRHLEALAAASPNAEGKLDAARKMITLKLHAPALAVLEAALAQKPAAETGVDLELAAAGAEVGLNREAAAATRLDRLLGRLAADYWRRTEILHRRTALVKGDADRETMMAAARARFKAAPDDPGAALELAQLLSAFEFRREALDILLAAGKRLPASEKIEKAALDLFDSLRDERGREAFLAERLKAAPQRQDLALARARSLFLLSRREEALAVFDAFIRPLEAPARLTQTLELARFLRRSSLPGDAAALFERAVALAANRLDVRRELAEIWLALGQKQKARALFTGPLPDDTEVENLLDVIQFFLKQEMFAEARSALAARLAKEPQNFDLHLMQITVAARLADRGAGEQLLDGTRALADTEARYRRWLEAAVAYHETFETVEGFLAEERGRVLAGEGGWKGLDGQRRLIFADVAGSHGGKNDVAGMIAKALAEDLPPELRIELRRRQLALVENAPAESAQAEEQLKALEKEDPARVDEYRIRRALLAMRAQQPQSLMEILGPNLQEVDVSKVTEAPLLTGFENLLRQAGGSYGPMLQQIIERLIALDPTNRSAWERWIGALAMSGDEERLRTSLRRLLEGVDRLPLGDETRALLRAHLLGSCWRSLALLLRDEAAAPGHVGEALPLLDMAGRLAEQRDEWLWIAWTRAYVLNQLGQTGPRDGAIRELERVAGLPVPAAPIAEPKDGNAAPAPPVQDTIAFPDGMVIGLGQARGLLTAPVAAAAAPPAESSGPRGRLRARWAFETNGRRPLASVMPLDGTRLLAVDDGGRLYAVDSASGKLLWSREGPLPLSAPRNDYGGNVPGSTSAAPVVEGGRIFLPMGGHVECWSGSDGHLLWRASQVAPVNAALPVYPTLVFHDGAVLVCDPVQARISALDATTGKVRWMREYPKQQAATPVPVTSQDSGASYSEGRIFFYGAATVVVSAATGDVLWSFDAGRAKAFPISLAEQQTPAVVTTPTPMIGGYGYSNGWRRSLSAMQGGAMQILPIDYWQARQQQQGMLAQLQAGQQFALLNSAATWAAGGNGESQRRGVLVGRRLLLFSSSGLHIVRLDLPFAGQQVAATGVYAGTNGRYACLGNPGGVALVDLESGKAEGIEGASGVALPQATEDDADVIPGLVAPVIPTVAGVVRIALAGTMLYVSDASGISGYHVRTRQRILLGPWPKSVAPVVAAPAKSATPSPQAGYSSYQLAQMGYPQQSAGQPMAGLVAGGVFYTEAEAGRLVALVGDAPQP